MKLIFEKSCDGHRLDLLPPCDVPVKSYPDELLRKKALLLPELSENEISRHYTQLAGRTFGVNDGCYPLGSCTMKYNPKVNETSAALPGFTKIHPLQPESSVQGCLRALKLAETLLCEITGMDRMTFQPAAGAHGEFTGLLLIKAYHEHRGGFWAQKDHCAGFRPRNQSGQRFYGRIYRGEYPVRSGRVCGSDGSQRSSGRGYGRSDADQSQYGGSV